MRPVLGWIVSDAPNTAEEDRRIAERQLVEREAVERARQTRIDQEAKTRLLKEKIEGVPSTQRLQGGFMSMSDVGLVQARAAPTTVTITSSITPPIITSTIISTSSSNAVEATPRQVMSFNDFTELQGLRNHLFLLGLINIPSLLALPLADLREVVGALAHKNHGKGSATDGPDEQDCACRNTFQASYCAKAGCGFCLK